MKILSFNPKPGLTGTHRKDKGFQRQLTGCAVVGGEIKEIVTVRIYGTPSTVFACLWINGLNCSGSGKATGYGFHRASEALHYAIKSAGIELSEAINGRGDGSMIEAVEAILKHLNYPSIHVIDAYA